jgi:hypothetical protein
MRVLICLLTTLAMSLAIDMRAYAQASTLGAEFTVEGRHVKEHCTGLTPKELMGCAMTVVTDHPLHLALGSLAPGNGFALGVAFVTSQVPNETWRLSWSADAVRSFSGAWRAGGYLRMVHTPLRQITAAPASATTSGPIVVRPHTVLNLYAQAASLHTLHFFGVGGDSRREDDTTFGMKETIAGANAVVPVARLGSLNLALLAEANGRFVSIRDGIDDEVPSIGDRFSGAAVPGLDDQPGVFQIGEGVRLRPSLFGTRLQLDYTVSFQQFLGAGPSSFHRTTIDLAHEIPVYRTSQRVRASDAVGPNECVDCLSISRNRSGTIGVRVLYGFASAGDAGAVPFYFQPTLGGADINGQTTLPSFDDYRFRGPALVLFQETFEHSLWGPIGVYVQADQGKVAVSRDALNLRDLKRSFALGLTLRAGGFPQFTLSYAWGGGEGRHVLALMSTSLLGGSSRPRFD